MQPHVPYVTYPVAHTSCIGSRKAVEYCITRVMTFGKGRAKEGERGVVSHAYQISKYGRCAMLNVMVRPVHVACSGPCV